MNENNGCARNGNGTSGFSNGTGGGGIVKREPRLGRYTERRFDDGGGNRKSFWDRLNCRLGIDLPSKVASKPFDRYNPNHVM